MSFGTFTRQLTSWLGSSPRGATATTIESKHEAGDPFEELIRQGRFGVLVIRPADWSAHRSHRSLLNHALRAIDERFAMVPEGVASLCTRVNDEPGGPETEYQTGAFLLARHCVTNAEFQPFVDGRGYEDYALWPEEVWPHLIDFHDQSGHAGPRYWRDGQHDRRLANHPVVGICWYEAAAYAAWAGYRLPTEPEWQMAASWRLRAAAPMCRRYPWGDALDLSLCNIWASGHGGTLPVDSLPQGGAPNGTLQLIGNVWEWVDGDFDCVDDTGRPIVGETLMKSIRGGAYDTYFPWQATSTFRTGLPMLARLHNVGFRCALDVLQETEADA